MTNSENNSRYQSDNIFPIYCKENECVVNQKDMKGCGECEHIPCEIWRKTKDPAFTEEEFERNIQERVDRLKKG